MVRFAIVAMFATAAAPASAQGAPAAEPPHIAALSGCRQLTDSAARLACYDAATAALLDANRQGEVALINREQVRTARRSLFGFPIGRLPFFGRGSNAPEEEEPREIETTLTSISAAGLGRYRFTVENGQAAWETTESMYLGRNKSGAKVHLRKGALGSYFVRIGSDPWVRARRVR